MDKKGVISLEAIFSIFIILSIGAPASCINTLLCTVKFGIR